MTAAGAASTPRPTLSTALDEARRAGLSRLDAQLLLAAIVGRPRAWLLAHDDTGLDEAQAQQWADWLHRRAEGEPVAYLLGTKEFHGLSLQVDRSVLVPRPDTETLVDWALSLRPALPASAAALDLGTGSGAIALALAQGWPGLRVCAVDRSAAALDRARSNGEALGLSVDWRQGDWFSAVPGERYDLVVSNPPYIAEHDPHLPALRHEPREALVAGPDGLDDLRRIVAGAPPHLQAGAWLLLEHGHDQADAVARLLHAAGYHAVQHRVDLGGHRRCTGAQAPG